MAEMHIDNIVVREAQQRLSSALKDMKMGVDAADALLWFSTRLKAGAKPSDLFSITIQIHDGASGIGKPSLDALQTAARHFHGAILEKAIALAQAQLESAEKARKEGAL
jgi:hypothetical protein